MKWVSWETGAGLSLCSSAFVWETFLQILKCCSDFVCTVKVDGASGSARGGGLVASGEGDIAGREGTVFWNRENLGKCCRIWSCVFLSCIPCLGDRVSEVISLLVVWLSGN